MISLGFFNAFDVLRGGREGGGGGGGGGGRRDCSRSFFCGNDKKVRRLEIDKRNLNDNKMRFPFWGGGGCGGWGGGGGGGNVVSKIMGPSDLLGS